MNVIRKNSGAADITIMAKDFHKRIQNSTEIEFISDDLLHSLLEDLELEEMRRRTKEILGRRIVRRIFNAKLGRRKSGPKTTVA